MAMTCVSGGKECDGCMACLEVEEEVDEIQELKDDISFCIDRLDCNGVTKLNKSPKCFTVSVSTIMANDVILSPFYYDFNCQKEALLDEIDYCLDIEEAIESLQQCIDMKMVDGQPLHPDVIKAIGKLF